MFDSHSPSRGTPSTIALAILLAAIVFIIPAALLAWGPSGPLPVALAVASSTLCATLVRFYGKHRSAPTSPSLVPAYARSK